MILRRLRIGQDLKEGCKSKKSLYPLGLFGLFFIILANPSILIGMEVTHNARKSGCAVSERVKEGL